MLARCIYAGFPDRTPVPQEAFERHRYSRLDASVIYRYSIKGYHFEAGISIGQLQHSCRSSSFYTYDISEPFLLIFLYIFAA